MFPLKFEDTLDKITDFHALDFVCYIMVVMFASDVLFDMMTF